MDHGTPHERRAGRIPLRLLDRVHHGPEEPRRDHRSLPHAPRQRLRQLVLAVLPLHVRRLPELDRSDVHRGRNLARHPVGRHRLEVPQSMERVVVEQHAVPGSHGLHDMGKAERDRHHAEPPCQHREERPAIRRSAVHCRWDLGGRIMLRRDPVLRVRLGQCCPGTGVLRPREVDQGHRHFVLVAGLVLRWEQGEHPRCHPGQLDQSPASPSDDQHRRARRGILAARCLPAEPTRGRIHDGRMGGAPHDA